MTRESEPEPALPRDVKLFARVIYTGRGKFGFGNEHTDTEFRLIGRSWDSGSGEFLYHIKNEWGEERTNVPARYLKLVEEDEGRPTRNGNTGPR